MKTYRGVQYVYSTLHKLLNVYISSSVYSLYPKSHQTIATAEKLYIKIDFLHVKSVRIKRLYIHWSGKKFNFCCLNAKLSMDNLIAG